MIEDNLNEKSINQILSVKLFYVFNLIFVFNTL